MQNQLKLITKNDKCDMVELCHCNGNNEGILIPG